jgi:hypothetical protein
LPGVGLLGPRATFDDGSLCDILVAAWEKAILIHEKVGN